MEVLGELDAAAGGHPLRGSAPDHGEQVRTPGGVGTGSSPDSLQGLGERLRRQVLGGVGVTAAGACVCQHGAPVTTVDLGKRIVSRLMPRRLSALA